jgi:hypothetical protein
MAVVDVASAGHCEVMTDLPFTSEDERAWDDDEFESGVDETDRIDAEVLSEASEGDALDQRRAVAPDDDHDLAGEAPHEH